MHFFIKLSNIKCDSKNLFNCCTYIKLDIFYFIQISKIKRNIFKNIYTIKCMKFVGFICIESMENIDLFSVSQA